MKKSTYTCHLKNQLDQSKMETEENVQDINYKH